VYDTLGEEFFRDIKNRAAVIREKPEKPWWANFILFIHRILYRISSKYRDSTVDKLYPV